uniref:Reverse transcriptase zinc-binding domain-containing protein n=1 Tax=Quercus lobata TaxID=97700 RepID=A0A7N2KTR2_QUELO
MCKRSSESVDHLFLHCSVASELWDTVFGLFGVCWIMPSSVVGLFACWQGHFGRLHNGVIWKVVPLCLMWCIWKERNSRCFEDSERAMPDLKLLFIRTLLECWAYGSQHWYQDALTSQLSELILKLSTALLSYSVTLVVSNNAAQSSPLWVIDSSMNKHRYEPQDQGDDWFGP